MRRRGRGQEEPERPREVWGPLNLGDPVFLGLKTFLKICPSQGRRNTNL